MKTILRFHWSRFVCFTFSILLISTLPADGQISVDTVRGVKGSYLHYGHAAIEDNSMFVEEAFNQGKGVIQFITGTLITSDNMETAFEMEIPLGGEDHQISFGSSYSSSRSSDPEQPAGLGDIRVSYRPKVSGKHHWAMVIPRITFSIPRKNNVEELRYDKPNVEGAVAVTKRLSKKLTSHFNAGTAYQLNAESSPFLSHTIAGSVIWAVRPRINFMLESVYKNFKDEFGKNVSEIILNPAIRFSFALGHYQVIPGVGAPVCMTANSEITPGAFLYLSIEPF